MTLRGPLRRFLLRSRYLLFQRHRHGRLALERIAGRPFLVLPSVFNPALFFSSELLAQAAAEAAIDEETRVLDLGCGSGILAVTAARRARRVIAVDANPDAVRCTRLNALLNHCEERIAVLEGDLFGPVEGEIFDLVLCNPPFFRGAPRDGMDAAWRADGFPERFAPALGAHLAASGSALMVLSNAGDQAPFLGSLGAAGFRSEEVRRRAVMGEVLTVFRFFRPRR